MVRLSSYAGVIQLGMNGNLVKLPAPRVVTVCDAVYTVPPVELMILHVIPILVSSNVPKFAKEAFTTTSVFVWISVS
jgi:hypothetical protein